MNTPSDPETPPLPRAPHPAHPFGAGSASATVVVADWKPLALLATAGVLHQAGMRCVCARSAEAVLKAAGIDPSDSPEEPPAAIPTATEPSESGIGRSLSENPAPIDLIVWDVGDQPDMCLQTLSKIRQTRPDLPAVLLAESRWAGLEKKTELLAAPTRCLFKPIDPPSLVAVAEMLLWMPALQSNHRRRGSRPARPGWVTLSLLLTLPVFV